MAVRLNIAESGLPSTVNPTLLLLHGLGGNLQLWDPVVASFDSRFHVLRFDLRGHGESDTPSGPWCLSDFVEDLLQVLDQLSIASCSLAGFSLGGLIGQKIAIDYPERINQLAIISAIANRTEEERQKVQERVANLEQGKHQTNIELALDRWFSPEFRQQHPEKVAGRLETLKATDPEGYLHAYRVFAQGDLGSELHRIKCPTLVMTGEFDPGSNPRMSRQMHQSIAGSRLEILEGLRHSVLVEAPDRITALLDDFFQVSG